MSFPTGPSGRLLQLLGERIRESDEKARTDALRHRQFLTLTTEEILKHSVEEAETSYKVRSHGALPDHRVGAAMVETWRRGWIRVRH